MKIASTDRCHFRTVTSHSFFYLFLIIWNLVHVISLSIPSDPRPTSIMTTSLRLTSNQFVIDVNLSLLTHIVFFSTWRLIPTCFPRFVVSSCTYPYRRISQSTKSITVILCTRAS
jgi:hypothetical protein